MIRTIEVLIGVSLLFTLYLLGTSFVQPQTGELASLKEKAITIIEEKAKSEPFRQKVLDGNVSQVKADLNALIATPLEVQICSGLGETQQSCAGNTPSVRNYVTINYLVASTQSNFAPFSPKTLRVFVWLTG
jgi:hypothetical protein